MKRQSRQSAQPAQYALDIDQPQDVCNPDAAPTENVRQRIRLRSTDEITKKAKASKK
jgi:hypothetical protein